MSIDSLIEEIAAALPETSQQMAATIREVCLTYSQKNGWEVMAGGHPAVHIGECGGDFRAFGTTAEDALRICLRHIKLKCA